MRSAAAVACLLLGALLAFERVVFGGQAIWAGDVIDLYYPFRVALAQAIAERDFAPLIWSPLLFGGYPLFAEGQGGFLYPPNLVAFALLPPLPAYHVVAVGHFFLGSALAFLYARSVGASRLGAIVAGFGFVYSGFWVASLTYMTAINAAAWLPLVLLLVDRALRRSRSSDAALAALVWGVAFLAGHPQVSALMLVGVALYAGGWLLAGGAEARFASAAKSVVIVVALGACVAAVQLLPTAELAGESIRTRMTAAGATQFSLPPHNLITLVAPFFYFDHAGGRYWEPEGSNTWLYPGVVVLGLALVGVATAPRRVAVPLALLAAIALLLAMGRYLPFYELLRAVPGFGAFRVPGRFAFVFDFAVPVLAAHGLTALQGGLGRRPASVVAVGAIALGVALAAFDAAMHGLGDAAFVQALREGILAAVPNSPMDVATQRSAFDATTDLSSAWVAAPPLLLLATGLGLLAATRLAGRGERVVPFGLAMLAAADLLFFASLVWPYWRADLRQIPVLPPSLSAARTGIGGARTYTGWGIAPSEWGPNRLLPDGVPSVLGYSPLAPVRNNELFSVIHDLPRDRLPRLLASTNTGYAHYSGPSEGDPFRQIGLTEIARDGGVLYELPATTPRAYAVHRVRAAAALAGARAHLLDPGFAFGEEVVLEGTAPPIASPSDGAASTVAVEEYRPLAVRLSARMAAPGVVVLSDLWYPGWHASVDGVETTIYPANQMFRAVAVPAGEHEILFEYRPRALYAGALLTALGLLVAVVIVVAGGRVGGPGRIRTFDLAVMSRLLCR